MSYVIDTKSFAFNGETLTFGGNELVLKYYVPDPRYLTLNQTQGGTIAANKLSGYDGDTVTLSQTPSNGYAFNNYSITGATLTGSQFNFNGGNVTAQANYTQTAAKGIITNFPVTKTITGTNTAYSVDYKFSTISAGSPTAFYITAQCYQTATIPTEIHFYLGYIDGKDREVYVRCHYLPEEGSTYASATYSSYRNQWLYAPTAYAFGVATAIHNLTAGTTTTTANPILKMEYEIQF